MTTEPTDADIIALADKTRTGEPGRDGYILPISFARAVLAKWGTPAPAQAGEYPELPVPLVLESGYGPGDVPDAYTASQMRAYVDADRAARKPLALVAFFMEKL